MNKIIKTTLVISILLTFTALIIGCGGSTQKSPKLSEIEKNMSQKIGFKDMVKLDDSKLKKIYGITTSELEESFVYISNSNVKADEVAVFKVKDSSNVDEIKDKINKRIEKQSTSFKDYVPDQYSLVQHNLISAKGKYILFVVSGNKDKFEDIFDNAFK